METPRALPSLHSNDFKCQKRPTIEAKETYYERTFEKARPPNDLRYTSANFPSSFGFPGDTLSPLM